MTDVSTARVIASTLGLSAFAIALFSGLSVDNPTSDILLRALIAMAVCSIVGLFLGMVVDRILTDYMLLDRAKTLKSESAAASLTPGQPAPSSTSTPAAPA